MAKQSLASMSVEALLELRDKVAATLSGRVSEMKRQLARLGGGDVIGNGRRARSATSSLKGRKVAPKYRGPGGELWAGRGAMPRWMQAAVKGGAKKEDFLIAKGTARKAAKKSRKRKAA